MSRRLIAAAVTAAVVSACLPASAKVPCNTPAEIEAMQLRQFQIELMVSALKCQGTGYDFRGGYGDFAQKAGGALSQNAKDLKAMFVREGKGAGYMDKYTTNLSNDAQLKSSHVPDYCGVQAKTLQNVETLKPHEIYGYAAQVIGTPDGAEACHAAKSAEATPTKKRVKKAQTAQ